MLQEGKTRGFGQERYANILLNFRNRFGVITRASHGLQSVHVLVVPEPLLPVNLVLFP